MTPRASLRRPFLTARWLRLAMLNYEVDPHLLAKRVPRETQLDFFQGATYLSVVGFLFDDTRLLGIPVLGHRTFQELNLRFYVRREIAGEVRRGVSFIKEIVPRWPIAFVARLAYNENYVTLPMRHQWSLREDDAIAPVVSYEWRLGGKWHKMEIKTHGQTAPIEAGSHEEFITEHYWGYCEQRDGGTVEYQVEHPRWRVWPSANASLDCDIVQLYGPEFVEPLSRPPVSAFVADGSAVTVYRPARIA